MSPAEAARARRRRFVLARHRAARARRVRLGLERFYKPGVSIDGKDYREVRALAFLATRLEVRDGGGSHVGFWLHADDSDRPLLMRIKSAQGVMTMINDLFTIGWRVWPREFEAATGEPLERPAPPERPS